MATPSSSCLVCGLPLTGALAAVLGVFGVKRGTRNPNCCTRCNAHIEEGRLVELTMLFADLSSFTELTGRLGAESTFGVVDKYLRAASEELTAHGAFIDKYVGDAVMAFFNVPVKREDHAAAAVAAARRLQQRLPELSKDLGEDLRASVGIATGFARVGRLGSDDAKDYTAIGDVVNRAARLQAQAKAGQILVSREVYERIQDKYPNVAPESLVLKGFREPAVAYRLGGTGAAAGPAEAVPPPAGPQLTWGGLAMAVMGGGCLGKIFVGSAALAWGAGAGSALLALSMWLDHNVFRVPLLIAAAGAAVWSLVRLFAEARERAAVEAKNGCIVPTPGEKMRNLLVAAVSFMALGLVTIEVLLHNLLRHGPKP